MKLTNTVRLWSLTRRITLFLFLRLMPLLGRSINNRNGNSSALHRTGRGGGRPPDNRSVVFLKGCRVVKKSNARAMLARNTAGIPCELFDEHESHVLVDDDDRDNVEGVIEEDEGNAQPS